MSRRRTQLFAVLVGINSYKVQHPEFRTLRGAVPDSLAFKSYLESKLNVPSTHITLLTNENATRANIISALQRLRDDRRIAKGDPILFYYAGHGALIDPPNHRDFGAGNRIQAIVPYDCDIYDNLGRPILPLPDYVIGILLAKIAETKGDNITVIFDSCYSSSGTRGANSGSDEIARCVELPSSVYSAQLDEELLELETISRGAYTPSKFGTGGLGSHILLAACGPTQEARESSGRGRFSVALLQLLDRISPDMLVYSDILAHLRIDPIPGQDPQCEGLHTNRVLFNGRVLPNERKSFQISPGKNNGEYIVSGGQIHNITPDAEFAVYRATDINPAGKMGVLYVVELHPFFSITKLLPGIPQLDLNHPTDAVQTKFGKQIRLRIHIPPQDGFCKIYANLAKNRELKHYVDNIAPVENSRDSQVEIMLRSRNGVEFKMHIDTRDLDHVPPSVRVVEANLTDLAWIFSKMAHFYWESKPSHVNARILNFVDVEFYELREERYTNHDTGYEEKIFKQVDPRSNLCINGVIELSAHGNVDEQKPYGIKLVNRSSLSLHANVFYFNTHDLEISAWVKSHHGCTTKGPDIPLRPQGGSLEVGFDPTAGHLPRCFPITNDLDIEVGFLKIYLSTESVNLAYLEQPSPFTPTRGIKYYESRPEVTWADTVIPVILRRH